MKKCEKQMGFSILEEKAVKAFGGALLKNSHAKIKRPIAIRKPMHLVLWSALAKGPFSFLTQRRKIEEIILKQGRRHGVRVYRLANAGNHLHLVILASSREAFRGFVRSIAGLIARLILRAERGRCFSTESGREKSVKLWSKRPFTRIIEWGRDFRGICAYLMQNTLEARGFIPYQPRKNRYRESTA